MKSETMYLISFFLTTATGMIPIISVAFQVILFFNLLAIPGKQLLAENKKRKLIYY